MSAAKKRSGWLTAWLILIILGGLGTAFTYFVNGDALRRQLDLPGWALPVLGVLSLFNVLCAVGLFMWKKIGFWGLCASSIVAFIVNLSVGLGIVLSVIGLLSPLILYGILQVGGENKGWPQLN